MGYDVDGEEGADWADGADVRALCCNLAEWMGWDGRIIPLRPAVLKMPAFGVLIVQGKMTTFFRQKIMHQYQVQN